MIYIALIILAIGVWRLAKRLESKDQSEEDKEHCEISRKIIDNYDE